MILAAALPSCAEHADEASPGTGSDVESLTKSEPASKAALAPAHAPLTQLVSPAVAPPAIPGPGSSATPAAACAAAPADTDSDGVYDVFEDRNKNGDCGDDDTDGDGSNDFEDKDDDNDGTPTASENPDPNANGDPADAQNSDSDGFPDFLDCANSNPAINPGATETPGDGIDQNCNGAEICFLDDDDDGYRPNNTATVVSADLDCADTKEATNTDPVGDCNDADKSIYPGATEIVADGIDQSCNGGDLCYLDNDNDGFRPNASATIASLDLDCTDSKEAIASDPTTDCNDNAVLINPNATEGTGDSIDQNCDGKETCYLDGDNDGYRPNATATVASTDTDCADSTEAGSFEPTGDCNDSNAAIHPNAAEIPADGVDQNCNGNEACYLDADNDGYRPSSTAVVGSTDLDCLDSGEAVGTDPIGDCNDSSASVNPGATEVVGNSVDNNCDGAETCYVDVDNDGYRPNSTATVASTDADCADSGEAIASDPTGDCNDANAAIRPNATEIVADGVDQNCNGGDICYLDQDNDGYRPNATAVVNSADLDCNDSFEAIASDPTGDCKDTNAAIHPGATETCGDGVDSNCNCPGGTDFVAGECGDAQSDDDGDGLSYTQELGLGTSDCNANTDGGTDGGTDAGSDAGDGGNTGGSGGTGGSGTGGAGTGGTGGTGTGGGGSGGTGGGAGAAGAAGSAGSGTGGSGTGGSGTGGSGTGGSGTGGKGTGGAEVFDPGDDGGCGCRVPAEPADAGLPLGAGLAGLIFALRRRLRKR